MNFVQKLCLSLFATLVAVFGASSPGSAQQQQQRPNIVAIMGDDIGWFNIGAYHRGIMAGRTPNLDQLASEGLMFTDYYAEPSHGWTCQLHYWRTADPHRPDNGRSSWFSYWHAG